MLRFMYTNTVKNLHSVAIELIQAAEKYEMPKLKAICGDYIILNLSNENIVDTSNIAYRISNMQMLLSVCVYFVVR